MKYNPAFLIGNKNMPIHSTLESEKNSAKVNKHEM